MVIVVIIVVVIVVVEKNFLLNNLINNYNLNACRLNLVQININIFTVLVLIKH